MFESCVIRGVNFTPARFCAPLAGYTHSAFRRLVAEFGGCGAFWTEMLAAKLRGAGTIVWNGPVGVFEFDAFSRGTETIARAIAGSPAFSIAGGGDTLAAIAKYGIERDIGYISTGGGAFLEVLEGKMLPAFEILQRRAQG